MKDFDKDYNSITEEDLSNLESLINAELPQDYKRHMLEYNGGSVPLGKEYIFSIKDEEIILGSFHQMKYESGSVEDYFSHKHDFLFPKLLSIGTIEGGYLAMGYLEGNFGEIHVGYSDKGPYKIANSFTEFLQSLKVVNEE